MARILAVDDQSEILLLLERMLSIAGHVVTTAMNGAEALEKARGSIPDIVITDLMMPIMSGSELIVALRADDRTASIPIVVLSAYPEGATAGADAFIRKPFMQGDLLDHVAALVS